MKRKIRAWLRRWIPRAISLFEPKGRKGKWFENRYYTYLFTRHKYYSSVEPNEEELQRWTHIELLIRKATESSGRAGFANIIDFGCGRGWLSNKLNSYGKVTGLDPIAKVVAYGVKIYPGLDLRQGTIEHLRGQQAELIVCSEVIEHISRSIQPLYMKAFYQALMPDGYLIITTPRKEAFAEWAKYVALDQPIEEWLTETELKLLAEQEGFKVVGQLTYGRSPIANAPKVEIYQQWLFQR